MITSSTPPPFNPLSTNWTQTSINYYFHHFLVEPRDGLPGQHEALLDLYVIHPQPSFLQFALQAVGLASLARVNHMGREYWIKAQCLYGHALRCLRDALAYFTNADLDIALMTIELLIEYEVYSAGHGIKFFLAEYNDSLS